MRNARICGRIFYMWGEKMKIDLEGIDFNPDYRSLYLKSLKDEPGFYRIYNEGTTWLSSHSLFGEKYNNLTMQKFKMALLILERGINQEREVEQAYFNNILTNSSIDLSPLKNEFSNLFASDGSFNYIKFIELINKILLGTEEYKSILDLEGKRLEELNNNFNSLIEGLNEEAAEQKYTNFRNIYLERHSLQHSEFSSYFSNVTSTIDYIMAETVNATANEVLKDQNLINIIQQQIISNNNITNDEIKLIILNKILKIVTEKIPEIVNAALNKNANLKQKILTNIEEELINDISIISINGQDYNFGQKEKSNIKIYKNENKEITYNVIGENLAQNLLKLIKTKDINSSDLLQKILYNKIDEEKTVLDKLNELQKLINEANNIKKNLKKQPENQMLIEGLSEIQKQISKLKVRISTFVRNDLDKLIEENLSQEAKIVMAENLQKALAIEAISITGPQFSEIIDSIIQKIKSEEIDVFFSGPQNLKADTINIMVPTIKLNNNNNKSITNLNNQINNYIKNNTSNFYKEFQSYLPGPGEATSFKQGKEAWKTAIKNQANQLINQLSKIIPDKQKQLKMIKEVMKQLKETIVTTNTMKTFNQYQNTIGFISGSIGPNISTQLNNIAELFESAGVGLGTGEIQWLEIAIVNCAPAALGDANQNSIERYLSTLAGFAVFDEGSAEIETLASTAQSYYMRSSPKLMHLYKLNGFYFPGSYILQRIFDNLKNIISSDMINTDGVKIRATADDSVINKTESDLSKRWSSTFNTASSNKYTSIEITFLSGLLNIVQQLKEAFNKP